MKHPDTRALYDYWNAIRLSRSAPLRSDLNPRELKTVLSRLFILQREDADSYVYRLAGTELCGYYGKELRGTNFLASWRTNEKQSISSLFQSITDEKTAAVLGVSAEADEFNQCQMEFILLPVRLDGSNEVRVVGCAGVFNQPTWVGRTPIEKQEIASLRLLWPDNAPRFMPHEAGTVEPEQDVFAEETTGVERRGHLWVIDGGGS